MQSVHYIYHHPDYFCPEPYDEYPSHLHIDLMQRVHRQGFGGEDDARVDGPDADQRFARRALGHERQQRSGVSFYTKLGFVDLDRQGEGEDQTIYMGKRLND